MCQEPEVKTKKKKKATVSVDVQCPCCKNKLHVDAWRIRTNEPVKAEYRVDTEVVPVVQGTFSDLGIEDSQVGQDHAAEIHG